MRSLLFHCVLAAAATEAAANAATHARLAHNPSTRNRRLDDDRSCISIVLSTRGLGS